MNIKKYPRWEKWQRQQSDLDNSFLVFEKSINLIKKNKGLIANFNLNHMQIYADLQKQKQLITEQYICKTLSDLFNYDNFDSEFHTLIKNISKIENIDNKYIKKCLNKTYSEISQKAINQEFKIKRSLYNLHKHNTITNIEDVIDWISFENNLLNYGFDIYDLVYQTSTELIIKVNSSTLFEKIGSPAWCVTHKHIYAAYYTSNYDCFILFEEKNNKIDITGFNFSLGLELISSIYNYFNKLCYTYDQTKYVKYIKSHMTKDDRFKNINKIRTTTSDKIFQAWTNNIKPSDMSSFYADLNASDIDLVISIFKDKLLHNNALVEYLKELKRSHLFLYNEVMELIFKKDNWSKLETSLLYEYILENNKSYFYKNKMEIIVAQNNIK